MIKVIGVRFRSAGKVYYFDPLAFDIKKGDHVIVETARGIEYGTVVGGIKQVADDEVIQPLKPVLRVATERDDTQEADNKRREKEAMRICLEKIKEHNLDMKLIDAEYTFDNNKVLFYFTAEGRIDFRELVKDLAAIFKTRIELRQIGVRDETKLRGGIGMCGRPLCCHTHLSDFITVSIKMAKEQNLSLNPTKISGVCGRLMCCLKHEEETYEELNRHLPHVGDRVTCPDGTQGEVSGVNVLRQLVKVVVEKGDSKEINEFKVSEIRFVKKGNRQVREEVSAEELRALELMEKQDKMDTQETEEKPVKGAKKERSLNKERGNRKEHLRKEQNDKENIKPRPEKNKNRNKDTQTVPVSQPVKEEGEHQTGQKAEGNAGNRNRKKPYYRNRRRNRPDGAKEQHEA
ncbi:MAG: stage 0 sporulation family protein [Lachnospiraceae bacterium]|nr:stage 0 sporulation family protein [Lachnospiraceae bacterium]MBR3762400.1 stage 0 sporulation family protein [Lachnospiraceae bacterium]